MKRIALLIACLSVAFALPAQTRFVLKGRVVDGATQEKIGFATVSLHRDSTAVAAVAADAGGLFSLSVDAGGPYRLEVTMVGYASEVRGVELAGAETDLGDVALRPGVDIADVVVEVQKPLVVSDAEKMTYSVEDDPQASTSTLDEIIRKVPQLSLDADGNVLLNGQSNYKILVNGRSSATMSSNFKEVIKSMPASQIQKIEVITHPSTKYEAEGVGGIINLVTDRRKQFDGYSGSVSAGASVLGMPVWYGNASGTVQTGKFAASAMGYYSRYDTTDHTGYMQEMWRENFGADNRYHRSFACGGYDGEHYGANLDLSYTVDSLNFLTLNGSLYGGRHGGNSTALMEIFDPQMALRSSYATDEDSDLKYLGGSVALNYEHTFNRPGHTLTVSDEVEIDPDRSRSESRFTGGADFPTYSNVRLEDNRAYCNTVQIDYANPINERHNIEAGLKHIYRYSDAAADLYIFDAGEAASAAPRFDDMVYRQHILALYAGYGFTFTKWSGRLGTRMERTWNSADVTETGREPYSIRNTLFNMVPYASLTFLPARSHSLSLSYTQRLQRPDISMLSPAVDDTDPVSVSYGNPDLRSAVFHSLNLSYGYFHPKWSALAGLTALISNNCMTSYTFTENGVIHTTFSDDVHVRNYGFNGSFSVRPSQKLNLSISLTGNYAAYDFGPMEIHTDRFSFSGNLNFDCALWKEARFMVGGYYNTGDVELGSCNKGYHYYYAGVKQSLFKQKLDISLSIANPFHRTTTFRQDYASPTYAAETVYRNRASRRLSINLSWRFGRQNVAVKRASRTINNDDLSGGNKSAAAGTGAPRTGR